MKRLSMIAWALWVLSVNPVSASDTDGKWGLGLHGGTYKLGLTDHSDAWTLGWLANADLTYGLTPKFALGVEGSWMKTYLADLSEGTKSQDGAGLTTNNVFDGPRQLDYVAGLLGNYRFMSDKNWSPYLSVGTGLYFWKWTDKDGNIMSSDDPVLATTRVPTEDLAGNPYQLSDQQLYVMGGLGLEFFLSESFSFDVGTKFRYLTQLFTDFTGDQDIVGTDPGQLDLPKAVGEAYVGLNFYMGGGCSPMLSTASGNPSGGTAPATVAFDASVSGGCEPIAYNWNFGDGESSAERSPSHTYQAGGNYSASFTATDSKGNVSQSSSVSVTVDCAPLTASAAGNPTSGTAPVTVKFSSSASGGCPPVSYSWNFGDGGSSSDQNPVHTYQTKGDYAAALTVTDSKGNTSQKTVAATISADEFVPTPETPLILKGVNFASDKAILIGKSKEILDRVAESLLAHPGVNIEVAGHCDAVNTDEYNLKLSHARANAVRDYLMSKGVPAEQLVAKGYGESQPIADNKTAAGRAENRRVELKRI